MNVVSFDSGQSVIQVVAILVNKDVLLSKDLERGIAGDLTANRGEPLACLGFAAKSLGKDF